MINGVFGGLVAATLVGFVLGTAIPCAAAPAAGDRRAIMMGSGSLDPKIPPTTHAETAGRNFLRLVGNPENIPGKGWTLDFSIDLMAKLGMNPTNTSLETLYEYLNKH